MHLHLEKLQLEHELSTIFPATEDILFDKDLELLMMNGWVISSPDYKLSFYLLSEDLN